MVDDINFSVQTNDKGAVFLEGQQGIYVARAYLHSLSASKREKKSAHKEIPSLKIWLMKTLSENKSNLS